MRRTSAESGIAHIVLLVLLVALGLLLVSAYLGSGTDHTTASPPAARIDVAAATRALDASVVDIGATLADGQGHVAGTGLVISTTGAILTNNHVIADTDSLTVQVTGHGPQYPARVVGYDVNDDIAVVQVVGTGRFSVAPTGDPAGARVGDSVVAIGNARGLGGAPATAAGTITAFGRSVSATDSAGSDHETLIDTIEIAAPVEPGDSGGPVVDTRNRVIALTAAATTGATSTGSGTSGFAIPIDRALAIARQILAGEGSSTVHVGARGILGVQVKTVRSTPAIARVRGAVVGLVGNRSGARGAGLQAGDVIVGIDDITVASLADLNAALDVHRPGDVVQLHWTDVKGRSHTAAIALLSGPPL